RRSWVLSGGVIEERTVVLGVGEISRHRYDVQRIEMRTGTWDTGAGRSDELVLWAYGRSSPLLLHPPIENAPAGLRAPGTLGARDTGRPFASDEQRVRGP